MTPSYTNKPAIHSTMGLLGGLVLSGIKYANRDSEEDIRQNRGDDT